MSLVKNDDTRLPYLCSAVAFNLKALPDMAPVIIRLAQHWSRYKSDMSAVGF